MDGASAVTPLWAHQSHAIERARSTDCLGLFFDTGTGKTRTTIEIVREHFNTHKRVLRTLILCPVIVMQNWKDEFLKFSKIPPDKILILDGSQKERLKMLAGETDNILILNYEGLLMEDLYTQLNIWGVEVLICDESHKLKSFNAKRTKLATRLADKAKYRYILSGTPITNSYLDLYSQFRILDRGASFGTNYYSFRGRYFWNANANSPSLKAFPLWKVRINAEKEITEIISKKALRVKKEECIDLPPLVRTTIPIELSPEQRKIYGEMERDFIAFIEGGVTTATIALTKALRLQQIVTGFVKLEDDRIIHFKENPRRAALKELLEEISPCHKVLVWACFKENYAQIREVCEELGIKFVEVHGEVSTEKKFEAVKNFNEQEDLRVFIGNPGAGGIGINLTSASYSIFYSRNFNAEHDWQAEARNYRGGSHVHAKITRIDLVGTRTLDEKIAKALEMKTNISEAVLREITMTKP